MLPQPASDSLGIVTSTWEPLMSLRVRLFLMIASMVSLLVLAQWWWVRSLTDELAEEVDSVALQIGNSVAEVLIASVSPGSQAIATPAATRPHCAEDDPDCRRLRVVRKVIRRGPVSGDDEHVVFFRQRTATRTEEHPHGHAPRDLAIPPGDADSESAHWVDRQIFTDDESGRHQVMTYSFDISRSVNCPEDDRDCARAADAVFMFADSHSTHTSNAHEAHGGVDRHLALHLNTWIPDDAVTEVVATGGAAADSAARQSKPPPTLVEAGGPRGARALGRAAAREGDGSVQLIPIRDGGVQQRIDRLSQRLMLGSGAFLMLGLLAAAFVAHRVSAPLRQLSAAAEQVGRGALGTQIEATRADPDVGQAIAAFNRMSDRLASLDRAHRELAASQHLGEIGDIARGLAHTLRNPLNALGLSLEEIAARAQQGDVEDEGTNQLVAGARRQIRRADHSIRSFLALASHGGEVERVDLAELARDVALEALQDAGRKVLVEVDAPDPAPIFAIAPEVRAVMQALVVNAVEASPGSETVHVTVLAATPPQQEDNVTVTVADRGAGLPESVKARLFTPHQTTKSHGSGMGLFLAHRMATTRYGGSLRIDPRPDGGTVAVLTLGPRQEGPQSPVERNP